jgi:hypothetical protein
MWNFLWQEKKRWSLNTDDNLIEVIAWTGLTVVSKSHDIFFNNQTTGLVRNLFFNWVQF